MADTKCKICRRAGQKLFLKGEKCLSPKCTFNRKPYAPGVRARRPKRASEYGLQLREKQKLKFLYGIREKQFVNYIKKAMKTGGSNIGANLIELLESRLDNVIFRMGLTRSRSTARQIVGHGHITVNGRRVSVPSYQVKKGAKIAIRAGSASKKVFADLDTTLKKFNEPDWIKMDKDKIESEIVKTPFDEDAQRGVNLNLIIEFYSR